MASLSRLWGATLLVAGLCLGRAVAEPPAGTLVRTHAELRQALAAAKAGTRIRLAPGTYEGGIFLTGTKGTEKAPVVVEAADPKNPPLLRGGASALHLVDPEHVVLRDLAIEGWTANGLNVDDGGTPASPARGLTIERVTVTGASPAGNRDGIKLSGVVGFRVEGCTVERWGTGGSAIDMVGCRDGVIERCTFRHSPEATHASGVQAKGASKDVAIRRCRFEHAGDRAVNVGGSTGLEFFRPPLAEWKGPRYEAKDIVVEGNTFVGSRTPVAFVGVDGAVFRFNTVYLPIWALRILQETRAEGFVPSRGGVVTDNLFVFRAVAWSEGGVNRGAGTAPETFRFERNVWWCVDDPSRTREFVRLPTEEKDGVYGKDPLFRDAARGDLRLRDGSPAAKAGAEALPANAVSGSR